MYRHTEGTRYNVFPTRAAGHECTRFRLHKQTEGTRYKVSRRKKGTRVKSFWAEEGYKGTRFPRRKVQGTKFFERKKTGTRVS